MNANPMPIVPAPSARDSDDVRWALSTAAALWNTGEWRDAVKWVGRAIEVGNDLEESRSLELWTASAELASAVEQLEERAPSISVRRAPMSPVPPPRPWRSASVTPLPPPPPIASAKRLPPVTCPPRRQPTRAASAKA